MQYQEQLMLQNTLNESNYSLVSPPKKKHFQNLPLIKSQKQKCNLFSGMQPLPKKKYGGKSERPFYYRLNTYRHRNKCMDQNNL